jgi:two-component system response regulator GlrR
MSYDPGLNGKPRILVVEDSEDFRLLLELTFRNEGYVVDGVATAEDALELIREHRYHLVVSDYALPGHSGAWLLSQARARAAYQAPAVVVTGDPDAPGIPDDIVVIRKPVDFDRLLSDIRNLLQHHRSASVAGTRPKRRWRQLEASIPPDADSANAS